MDTCECLMRVDLCLLAKVGCIFVSGSILHGKSSLKECNFIDIIVLNTKQIFLCYPSIIVHHLCEQNCKYLSLCNHM